MNSIGREQVQMLAASEVALMALGCIAAELMAALMAALMVERLAAELMVSGLKTIFKRSHRRLAKLVFM